MSRISRIRFARTRYSGANEEKKSEATTLFFYMIYIPRGNLISARNISTERRGCFSLNCPICDRHERRSQRLFVCQLVIVVSTNRIV